MVSAHLVAHVASPPSLARTTTARDSPAPLLPRRIAMNHWQRLHQIINFELFVVGGTSVTVAGVGALVLAILASLVFSRVVHRVAHAGARRRGLERDGTIAVVLRLLHYLILGIGIAVGLQTIGRNRRN